MSQSETRTDKRTDDKSLRRDRSYHAVPADWMRLGRHQHDLEGYERFYAAKICYEYRLERDPTVIGGVTERSQLHVAYRNPGTTEAVERVYEAAVVETAADTLEVSSSAADGEIGPDDWGTLEYAAITPNPNTAVIPAVVFDGEPLNWPASVAVRSDEPRIGEER